MGAGVQGFVGFDVGAAAFGDGQDKNVRKGFDGGQCVIVNEAQNLKPGLVERKPALKARMRQEMGSDAANNDQTGVWREKPQRVCECVKKTADVWRVRTAHKKGKVCSRKLRFPVLEGCIIGLPGGEAIGGKDDRV